LVDLSGGASATSVSVVANSATAHVGNPPPAGGDELLLHDSFAASFGGGWSVDFSGLADGEYYVFLYAPSQVSLPTGTMLVGGVPVLGVPGVLPAALIEHVSWKKVQVSVTGGALAVSGSGTSFSGLAGIQLVPTPPVPGLNLDFGTYYGVPAPTYGAASGQAGPWNLVGQVVTGLTDLSGIVSGANVAVTVTPIGGTGTHWGGTPTIDTQWLRRDAFYVAAGNTWSVDLTGLENGKFHVFLYASAEPGAPTGDMTVGGVAVPSFQGTASGSTLIEGTDWVWVKVTITDGTLAISGSGTFSSGLAGLQFVKKNSPANYCTAGTSFSSCTALISANGTPSATEDSGFTLNASMVEGAKDGLFFFGTNGGQANSWGSGTSFQCVVPPVKRAGLLNGSGTPGFCDGVFTQDLNALWCAACPQPLHNPGPGAIVRAQLWYRDPFNTSNQTTSLSNGIVFVVGP
jgi:hypothetical protein